MSKKCQNCGAELADSMNFCPQCHAKYNPPNNVSHPSTGSGKRSEKFIALAKVLLNDPKWNVMDFDKLTVLPSPKDELQIRSDSPVLFPAPLCITTITTKVDDEGNPFDAKWKLCVSFWGGIFAIFMAIGTIYYGFYRNWMHAALLMLPMWFVLGALIIILEHKKNQKRILERLEKVKDVMPKVSEFILPDFSSWNFKGKSAADIAAAVFVRDFDGCENITAPDFLAKHLELCKDFAPDVRPEDVIFLMVCEKSGLLFTMNRIYTKLQTGFLKREKSIPYEDVAGISYCGNVVYFAIKDKSSPAFFRYRSVVTPEVHSVRNRKLLDFIQGMKERR